MRIPTPLRLGILGALSLAAVGASATGGDSVGTHFASAPTHLEALLSDPGEPTLLAVQAHLEANDLHAALWEAERVTEVNRWGRDRDAAWMVQGMIHREASRHNLASAAFTKVRSTKGPLGAWGTYYEAEQDLKRGRSWVAARECKKYREKFKTGRHFDDCLRLMAVAYAKGGSWSKARAAATEYDKGHQTGPIREQVELILTLGALEDKPEAMVARLQHHAVSFKSPLTGRVAVQALADLRAKGFEQAVVPDDISSRKSRAYSLRNTKQTALAWEEYQGLMLRSADDPELAKWVEAEAETFGWRTRNWDFLAELYAARYAEQKTSESAWKLLRVLGRGGRWKEARAQAISGLSKHGGTSHWRRQEEEIGRTFMLAGDYPGARTHFDTAAKRGGWTGQRAAYYAALSGYLAGDDDPDTLKRLSKLADGTGAHAVEATYWRAKLHERLEKPGLAASDRRAVLAMDPDGWYAALVREKLAADDDTMVRRDGRWPHEASPISPRLQGAPPPLYAEAIPVAGLVASRDRQGPRGFGSIAWEPVERGTAPIAVDHPLSVDPTQPPPSYAKSTLFDKEAIRGQFRRYSAKHKSAWPDLEAAYDMARAGLYDLSGPMFSRVYEEWREAYKSGRNRKHAAARSMKVPPDRWRGFFAFVRDHHHTARFNHGVWTSIEDPELSRTSKKLAYPLAHDRFIWTHARQENVDPYLVLGLMRQESTYNAIAVSRVGASGAMQIMPRTGHLMADVKHDLDFTAGDLQDPILSVGYGIAYLGLLMERFDGAYPLAVASYNGGPFNVSSWLAGTGNEMPMDVWVEHIPFRETRDYVKRVSGGYATYLSLYAPEGTILAPPATPRGNHPEVVDF